MVRDYALADAEKMMGDVHPDSVFSLRDGSEIKSLKELYSRLQGMDDSVFSHHVNDERNDFSNWVRDVHKDYRLANSLGSSRSREDALKAVGDRLYELKNVVYKRKSRAVSETETAAERLEKILTEAAQAKVKELRKKKQDSGSDPSVVDLATGRSVVIKQDKGGDRKIRNVPFSLKERSGKGIEIARPGKRSGMKTDKKISIMPEKRKAEAIDDKVSGPTAEDLLDNSDDEVRGCIAGEADELKRLAESTSTPRQVVKEVSSIFSGSSFRVFREDMKRMFHSPPKAGDIDDDEDDREEEESTGGSVKEPTAGDHVRSGATVIDGKTDVDKKEIVISHLKRVFK